MPIDNNIDLDKDESIQRLQNLLRQNINSDEDVKLVFECLNDVTSLTNKLQELQQILEMINERLIAYEYNTDLEAFKDGNQFKKIPEYIEKLNKILESNLELGFKCAEFLVTNDNGEKLRELFNLNSKVFKEKLSFKLAKHYITKGNINGLQMLKSIDNISELNYGKEQDNLFHVAVANNQLKILELLFSWLVNKEVIDEKNQLGDSLLESAFKYSAKQLIKNGSFDNDIIFFLIENLDIKSLSTINSQKRNFVHTAAIYANIDALKVLISKLQNSSLINDLDEWYGTPLQLAINGASIDKAGVPQVAVNQGWISNFTYFNQVLNGYKYERNLVSSKNGKILVKNYEEIVKFLLSNLTIEQVNSKDNEGDSPIHECVVRSNVRMLKLILETKKGNINAQNNVGNTPLHCAVTKSSLPIIRLLLAEKKIDFTVKNHKGLTACELISSALRDDNKEIAELFIKAYQKQGIQPPKFLNGVSSNVAAMLRYFTHDEAYQYPGVSNNSVAAPQDINEHLGYDVVDSRIKNEESFSINEINNFIKTNNFDKLLDNSNTSIEFPKDKINTTIITTGCNDHKQFSLN